MSYKDKQTFREMDVLQRDRFELLSAYIDSEVTAAERKQVQELLATDPAVQRLYARLVELRRGLQTMPVPQAEQSPQHTAQQVFKRMDRRRTQKFALWGGAAIAAMFVGAVSGVVPGNQLLTPHLAQYPEKPASEPVMVALNEPVIEIPKAAVATPENLLKSAEADSHAGKELN